MAKVRIVLAAIAVVSSWLLNATSVTHGWKLAAVAATVSFVLLIWAELARHDAISGNQKLKDRIALLSDLGDGRRPVWYPEHRVNEGGPGTLYRNVTVRLYAQRRVQLDGFRCTFEDADGRVAVTWRGTKPWIEAGDFIICTYPQDFPVETHEIELAAGICRVLWEDNTEARADLCSYAFEIGEWTPIPAQ